ncbi:PREDICTED: TELO2-interacting protein 2-like, partial [Ceratosolen solmsi marchali]|uniref:TELO2-interacting protein 2-like n=1 Tax=Ceratosolen solmsi marchali TaxID=326594 RepID=A0AAJ7DUN8_9HYME
MKDKQLNEEFLYEFNKILMRSLVPHFSNQIIRPCIEEDFQDFKNIITDNLHRIVLLLDFIIQNEVQYSKRTTEYLIKVIVIIGEQHKKSAWNTYKIIELSELLIFRICKIFKSKNITEILKNNEIFIMIIKFLRPKLLKDTWKCFPAAVNCYKWLLELSEKPLLKSYIQDIVPTALIIVDDYVQENQMLALKCISIIIEHCQKSKILKNFNYDEVIFQALKKISYKVESIMMTSLYSCISSLISNIDCYEKKSTIFNWTKWDEILTILFDNMELQTNHQYQYAYITCLSKFLTYINLGKWSNRLIQILSEYCENNIDLIIINGTLECIKTFLLIYQPQGENFYIVMYSLLLKLRYKCALFQTNSKEIIIKVDQCILLISKLCPNLNKEIINSG